MSARTRALVVGMLTSAGCTTLNMQMTAAPLDPGRTEIGASLTGLIVEHGASARILPQIAMSIRHGVSDGFDVGLKLNAIGLEASTRHRLVELGRVTLAIVPSVGFEIAPLTNADAEFFLVRVGLGWLLDVLITDEIVAVFGLRPLVLLGPRAPVFADDPGGLRTIWMPGASLGVRIPLSRRWAIFPEVNVHIPWDSAERRVRRPLVEGGLGLSVRQRF